MRVTESLTDLLSVSIDFTDVTLVSEDTYTNETLAIDDTQGDGVRGGDWSAGHGGIQGGR